MSSGILSGYSLDRAATLFNSRGNESYERRLNAFLWDVVNDYWNSFVPGFVLQPGVKAFREISVFINRFVRDYDSDSREALFHFERDLVALIKSELRSLWGDLSVCQIRGLIGGVLNAGDDLDVGPVSINTLQTFLFHLDERLSYESNLSFNVAVLKEMRVLGEQGKLTLNEADSSLFNIAAFQVSEGEYVSGYELLRNMGISSLTSLFQGQAFQGASGVPEDLIDLDSLSRRRLGLTRDEALKAMRHSENLDRLFNLGIKNCRIDDNARWFLDLGIVELATPFLKLDGSSRLFSLRPVLRAFGLDLNRPDLEKFWPIMFDDPGTIVYKRRQMDNRCVARFGFAFVKSELRDLKNRRFWQKAGISFDGEKCSYDSTIERFRVTKFSVKGRPTQVQTIMAELNLNANQQEDILGFVQLIFPDYTFINWRTKSGHTLSRIDPQKVLDSLSNVTNKKKLKRIADTERFPGKVYVDLDESDFTGESFRIAGEKKPHGIQWLLDRLNLGRGANGIIGLYRQIFDAENIVTIKSPELVVDELQRETNCAVLLSLVEVCSDGSLIVDWRPNDVKLRDIVFDIAGRALQIGGVMTRLGEGRSKDAVRSMYSAVFTERRILASKFIL